MSDELERLARQAKVDGPRSTMPDWQHLDAFHQACTPAVILALLSERRELVAGLREAIELAFAFDNIASRDDAEAWSTAIAKLSALAARIAPNQDGEK